MVSKRSRRRAITTFNRKIDGLTSPCPQNAANLFSFFSAQYVDLPNLTWASLRGDYKHVYSALTSGEKFFIDDDGSFYCTNAGVSSSYGTGPVVTPTTDILMLVSGKLSKYPEDTGESPTISYRFNDAVNGLQAIKVRIFANPDNANASYIADQVGDDLGNEAGPNGATTLQRHGTNDDTVYTLAAAWDRSAGTWNILTYNVTNGVIVDDTINDISYITGTVTMRSNGEASSFTASSSTLIGRFFAAGLWLFPNNSLPSDWKEASIGMGTDWANLKFKLWDAWGTE